MTPCEVVLQQQRKKRLVPWQRPTCSRSQETRPRPKLVAAFERRIADESATADETFKAALKLNLRKYIVVHYSTEGLAEGSSKGGRSTVEVASEMPCTWIGDRMGTSRPVLAT